VSGALPGPDRHPAPSWLPELLGWKPATAKSAERCQALLGCRAAPNLADVGGAESLRITGEIYRSMDIQRQSDRVLDDSAGASGESGAALERHIAEDLLSALRQHAPNRGWQVTRQGLAADYAQFEHLRTLQQLFDSHPELRTTLGRDYQVRTDVHVGVLNPDDAFAKLFLHAAISCKWTIRSDRVQNVRHEFATLVRNRRGRLPHLVLVTAEPLPSRLISIARGTGEVDTVYHLLHDELAAAVAKVATRTQQEHWDELIEQRRIKPYAALARDLTLS
jgi:NgoMIV restriction enzyme